MNECFAPLSVSLGLVAPDHLTAMCAVLQAQPADCNAAPFTIYALIFLLNCSLEAPGYWLAGRRLGRSGAEIARQIAALNLATHPLVYYAFPYVAWRAGWSLLTMVALSELFAFSVEAALLRKVWRYPWPMAILASTAANLTSWWTGALLYDAGLAALL